MGIIKPGGQCGEHTTAYLDQILVRSAPDIKVIRFIQTSSHNHQSRTVRRPLDLAPNEIDKVIARQLDCFAATQRSDPDFTTLVKARTDNGESNHVSLRRDRYREPIDCGDLVDIIRHQ